MHRCFATVVAPIVEVLTPRAIAEVGAGSGRLTERLLASPGAARATVHAIDPRPAFDRDELAAGDARLVVHRERSLVALPELKDLDLVLLDGDPNWYTVHAELELLAAEARNAERALPVIVVHSVHWPYGRRDGYHDPEEIPEEARRPHAAELGGLRLVPFAATEEHGARNGVLTGLEDFLAADPETWHVLDVPGFHGTAVLVAASTAAARPALRGVLEALGSPMTLRRAARRAEAARVEALLTSSNRRTDGASDERHDAALRRLRTLERELADRDAERREILAARDAHLKTAVEATTRLERVAAALETARTALATAEQKSERLRVTVARQERRLAELENLGAALDAQLRIRRDQYDELAEYVRAATASRSWRWGHRITLTVRRLTFRRSVKSDGSLDVAVRAIDRAQLTEKSAFGEPVESAVLDSR